MSASEIKDLSRLAIHTITTKGWTLEQCVENFSAAGVKGITVWRQALEGRSDAAIAEAGKRIRDSGLSTVALCRGGFFPGKTEADRNKALDDNRRAIAEAAALGAPLIVLVCGAVPGIPLEDARKQIADGIAAVLPEASAAKVKLSIEPLHPMYAGDRSAVNTLGQANDLVEQLGSPWVGVAADVFHLWWDPALEAEIARCAKLGALDAFHICDWLSPMADMLNDRGLMGEGCIPIKKIRGWVEAAGFNGFNEVEVFSHRHWARDPKDFLADIVSSYLKYS
ncbi:Sugar phosphate isomerase/epimerase [Verrucomicrobium sp. GAS474]|uniref:sugar phosphate isomerase/epimerase family protein n=1 Tax=Verrucomicrobium sp. GAS474 TaxID=1882831 RepID=UPI00087989B0|nr:sugar phosphate isomerase/epimerase family protein [Verrucomicrobium sp. GAS474]SDT86011.1 Sugar phosphate isomerase/epimerase [Verrucomicrobium sp. GAS474]